jgi:predicted RecB family nuclease
MITNFIRYERKHYEKVEPSQRPVIIALEASLQTTINIEGRDKPVVLKGVIDRLEKTPSGYRIIDFKTGRVESNDVKCLADGSIMKKSKLLQLCMYMLLVKKEIALNDEPVSAGIFSFITSSKEYFMAQPYQDDVFPKPETFDRITAEIQDVVLEMLNSEQYTHTESDKSYCTYCTI